jgi:hypothetical protein
LHSCQISIYIYFPADASADKPTQKNRGEESPEATVDSTATEDNSNEIHSSCTSPRPGSNQIPAAAMIQMQQTLSSEGYMEQILAVTSVKEQAGQQSSMQADVSAAETIPVSSTHQTAAKTAWPTTTTMVIDIRGKYVTSKCQIALILEHMVFKANGEGN